MTIHTFNGDYRFLSNFWPAEVLFEGDFYPSSEHAYQAAKFTLSVIRKKFLVGTPGEAKRLGRKYPCRPDWDTVKYGIMLQIVTDKFTRHSYLKDMLLKTGDQELIEGNTWGDVYWGVCKGEGQNNLGKILMIVRDELNKEKLV